MASTQALLSAIPILFHSENWFIEWKLRLENKTEEQKELDEQLWNACYGYEWDKAEKLITKGATGDHVQGRGALTAYWFMKFEMVTSLMDQKFPNESRKAFITLKYYQEKLVLENIEINEKYFGRIKWMEKAENDLKNKTDEQIEKDAEVWWRCYKYEWGKAEEVIRKGGRNNFVDGKGITGIHFHL